ncbi:hypothetical protein JWS13_41225 [Rhodococcus pseudokoreensis]|uniref:DUF106 domain-containing protein n=1 Tax=Rhodococcus pseudokoreensis TaxID=2811421 RepID=A0A974ZY01_9NOCA|nr:hypothetical protein [Rhodococcus pseudokoreensis]QSE94581.1 hypothetical protein JWS13_41225 [Rhodococcus pseudokoreensis]
MNLVPLIQATLATALFVIGIPAALQHWMWERRAADRIERQQKIIDAAGEESPASAVLREDNRRLALEVAAVRRQPEDGFTRAVTIIVLAGTSWSAYLWVLENWFPYSFGVAIFDNPLLLFSGVASIVGSFGILMMWLVVRKVRRSLRRMWVEEHLRASEVNMRAAVGHVASKGSTH